MISDERRGLGKRVSTALFAAAFLCTLISILYVAGRITLENTRLAHSAPELLENGWRVEGGKILAAPSRPLADAVGKTLRLMNTLPESAGDKATLCFQTKNESVRVWVDGELCYTYGETPQRAYGYGVGAVWNLAELPQASGGKTITVELAPIGGRTGLEPYRFLMGDRGDVISFLLLDKLDMLIICLTLAIIGAGSVIVCLISLVRRNRWAAGEAFYFTLFVSLAAIWNAADSGLLQFVLSNKGVSYMLFGCSFYLLCSPFALFISYMLPSDARLFRVLAGINSVYAAARILLYMGGVLDFETALWLLHLLMAAFITVTNLKIWLPVLRDKRMDMPEMIFAVSSFTLCSGAALISFYLNDKLDQQRCGYSSGFYVGILLFVLITIVGVVRQTNLMRQKAFKADFFERRAYQDELTELLNVRGFDDKCASILQRADDRACFAVVDFDVNFFSQYNANNGLEMGDALLRRIADKLKSTCVPGELCARQEADHFVCLVRGESIEDILDRIGRSDADVRQHMSKRMLLISYGVAEVTERTLSPAALRNQALVAKRTVKGNYGKYIALYDHTLHEHQLREMELLSGFESSLEKGEYVIFLQPKLYAATEKLGGAEALVRRIGPDGTVTPAGPIIEALEQKGFVAKLDYYILEEVCRFQRRCMDEGREVCPVSSNFSRVHLYDPDFPQRLTEIVDRYAVPRELVEIELTETVFLAGKEALVDMVRRIRERGFKVSIDDFGSGYSSLNFLKDVEVDAIKLDGEFLAGFAENRRAGVVIEHTVSLARSMGITVVAEGVETAGQLDFLRGLGCELVQGYYYSRPVPVSEFVARYLS